MTTKGKHVEFLDAFSGAMAYALARRSSIQKCIRRGEFYTAATLEYLSNKNGKALHAVLLVILCEDIFCGWPSAIYAYDHYMRIADMKPDKAYGLEEKEKSLAILRLVSELSVHEKGRHSTWSVMWACKKIATNHNCMIYASQKSIEELLSIVESGTEKEAILAGVVLMLATENLLLVMNSVQKRGIKGRDYYDFAKRWSKLFSRGPSMNYCIGCIIILSREYKSDPFDPQREIGIDMNEIIPRGACFSDNRPVDEVILDKHTQGKEKGNKKGMRDFIDVGCIVIPETDQENPYYQEATEAYLELEKLYGTRNAKCVHYKLKVKEIWDANHSVGCVKMGSKKKRKATADIEDETEVKKRALDLSVDVPPGALQLQLRTASYKPGVVYHPNGKVMKGPFSEKNIRIAHSEIFFQRLFQRLSLPYINMEIQENFLVSDYVGKRSPNALQTIVKKGTIVLDKDTSGDVVAFDKFLKKNPMLTFGKTDHVLQFVKECLVSAAFQITDTQPGNFIVSGGICYRIDCESAFPQLQKKECGDSSKLTIFKKNIGQNVINVVSSTVDQHPELCSLLKDVVEVFRSMKDEWNYEMMASPVPYDIAFEFVSRNCEALCKSIEEGTFWENHLVLR